MTTAPARILAFVGANYVAGAEIAALEVLQGLKSHGHDVRCVVSGWNDGDFASRLRALDIPYDEVKLGFIFLSQPRWTLDGLRHYPAALRTLQRIRREFRPDVVYHVGYRNLLMVPWLFPASKTFVQLFEREPAGLRSRLILRAVTRRARGLIANSEFIARDLRAKGVAPDRIAVVYPAVHVESGSVADATSGGPMRVGIVGQLIPLKGHAELLEALHRVVARGHRLEVHVFGRGPDAWSAHLRELTARLGLQDRVHFHGFVPERCAIYSALDLVVVPTRGDEEAFGLVAAEPALWGLPVLAANGGGLPEVVVDGETGLLFRHDDVADLAEKLERLVADGALRARLGARARARVGELFSPEVATVRLERVFGVR